MSEGNGPNEAENEQTVNKGELMPVERHPLVVKGVLEPLVNVDKAIELWNAFIDFKKRLLVPWGKEGTDYQRIRVREKQPDGSWKSYDKDFPKKSAARKFAKYFGISDRIIEKHRVDRPDGSFVWHYTIEAWAPNGQVVTAEGACDSREVSDKRKLEHNTKSTAHTRAKSRGVFDLVGGGEVTAEEVTAGGYTSEGAVIEADYKVERELDIEISIPSITNYLKTAGTDVTLLDFADELYAIHVTPKKYLKDEWRPITDLIQKIGGEWTKQEKGKNHWRIPKPEEPPEEETPEEPVERPQPAPLQKPGSMQELEYILDGKFPGAAELFTVVPGAKGFLVEATGRLDQELVLEMGALAERMGGVQRLKPESLSEYVWEIPKGDDE